LPIFLLIAFGVPWTGWIGVGLIKSPTQFEMVVANFWFPAACSLAGFIAVTVENGLTGLSAFTARVFNLRFPGWLWAVALLTPPVAAGATFIFHLSDVVAKGMPNFALLLGAFANSGIGPAAEEFGWRGYLLNRICSRGWSPLVAGLAIGPIWAAWHIPLHYHPTFEHAYSAFLFIFWATAWSVILALIVARARGSVLPAIVAHWALNNQALFFTALLPGLAQNRMPGGCPFWLTSIAAAMLFAWFWRKLQWRAIC
jgi:membrane protease YdiL (CAAX protease family)